MVTALFLILSLASPPCAGHVAPRNYEAKKAFMQAHPCPGGPDRGSTRSCRGYVVDHICPLVCCGLDAPQNMQWQTQKAGKAKDGWERSCITCQPGVPTGQDGGWPEGLPRPASRAATNEREPGESIEDHPLARCKDGSFFYGEHHSGACAHHGGVAAWLEGK
ncbi:MAG TPA: DUF3761 domain-containing protein [Anaeromyxobacter sp.]|nr:DUF3761 domain-containing protein [Anaeromyxobacter sp.]